MVYFLLGKEFSLEPRLDIVPMLTFVVRCTYLRLIKFYNRWHCTSPLYRKSSTTAPHAYVPQYSKSRKNWRYLSETLLLFLSTNKTPPMNLSIHARANLRTCSSSSLFICAKWWVSQLNLTTLPLISPSCGLNLNNSSHKSAQSRFGNVHEILFLADSELFTELFMLYSHILTSQHLALFSPSIIRFYFSLINSMNRFP